jgi:hypothetical protein
MTMTFETRRLVMAEAAEEDIDGLLDVALSNPAFLYVHESSDGGPGRFDRSTFERDLAVAWGDSVRHPLALRTKSAPRVTRPAWWDGRRSLMNIRVTTFLESACSKCTGRTGDRAMARRR